MIFPERLTRWSRGRLIFRMPFILDWKVTLPSEGAEDSIFEPEKALPKRIAASSSELSLPSNSSHRYVLYQFLRIQKYPLP